MDEEQIVNAAAEIIRVFERKDKLADLAWNTLEMVKAIEDLEIAKEEDKRKLTNHLNYVKAVVKRQLEELNIRNDLPF